MGASTLPEGRTGHSPNGPTTSPLRKRRLRRRGNDPGVQITKEPNPAIAKMEKVDGGWKITPVAPGVTTVAAKLGDLTAK